MKASRARAPALGSLVLQIPLSAAATALRSYRIRSRVICGSRAQCRSALGQREDGGDGIGETAAVLQLGRHPQPELDSLGLLDPQLQALLKAVGADPESDVDGLGADGSKSGISA